MSSASPSSRSGHVAAVIDNEMLLWGGLAEKEATGETYMCSHDLIECFNLLTSEWNQRRATFNSQSDLPHQCFQAQIGVVQNRDIYQFGGSYKSSFDDRIRYFNDVYKLDGSTLDWQLICPDDESSPRGRSQHGMCVLGKKGDEHLVTIGGFGARIPSPIPDGSQFLPHPNDPRGGFNNETWFFSLRKRSWIPAHCTGPKPHPRGGHSFSTVDSDRAIFIGGIALGRPFHDSFLFRFTSREWIEMKLDDRLIPQFFHSTVVVDTPTLGPIAFVLSGYGENNSPLSVAQMILIDFLNCKTVPILDESNPPGGQSICFVIASGLLFLLRFGVGMFPKTGRAKAGALLDIFKYDLKHVDGKFHRHHLSDPIVPHSDIIGRTAPIHSKSPTMIVKETERLQLSTQRDPILVVTAAGVLLAFQRWKKFSTTVSSLDKGAEISIPYTGSTLRIRLRSGAAISTQSSIGFTVFSFDAKLSQGVRDDQFVSDLIQLSLPAGLTERDVEIEMCHEHGLDLDPTSAATSASKVVFCYQPHDPSAKTEHEIKCGEKIVINSAGEKRIAALLQSSVVKVFVFPSASVAAAVVSSDDDVSVSFFTHFYGLGCHATSVRALSFERIMLPDGWQFDLCFISTRPEHRELYLANRQGQPLLLDRSVNCLLLSPAKSNVVEARDIEGCINESSSKKNFISAQQLLAARNSPIDAWVANFYFTYIRRELLQLIPTMATNVTIVSGDRRQSLSIQCSESSNTRDEVPSLGCVRTNMEELPPLKPLQEMAQRSNPSRQEMDKLVKVMGSEWKFVAQCIVPVLTDSEINEIEFEKREEDQPGLFLDAWINKHGLNATREALCSALFGADLGSRAKEVFPEIYEEMTKEALLDPDLQIDRDDLFYDEDKDFLGGGGYGEVYKATLKIKGSERPVAVKVFLDFRQRRKEREYETFKKEASVLLHIKAHVNVLSLVGLCAVPRHYALVTEFVNGGSLSSLLKSPKHEEALNRWQMRIAFAKQIAEGMLHLHYNQPTVIHCDLKTQNVLVNILPNLINPFICKVADFGLSKMAGISSITTKRSSTSSPGGTVTHIAPERYSRRPCGDGTRRSQLNLARKADVYSYGVVLFEIREKQNPYKDMPNDLIRLHVLKGGGLPRGLAPDVPSFFNDIIDQCVIFEPQERPMFREILLMIMEGERSLNH